MDILFTYKMNNIEPIKCIFCFAVVTFSSLGLPFVRFLKKFDNKRTTCYITPENIDSKAVSLVTKNNLSRVSVSIIMIICLGPVGSGKTLLLKNLQNCENIDNTTTAVPTMGTNIFNIKVDEKCYQVREIGGAMAPIWSMYLNDVNKVIYVVDASNLCQISAACVLLYTILVNPALKHAEFLLVLTKMDVSYRQMRNEALLMLQMKRLQKEVKQCITITEASAISGEGRKDILNWIKKSNPSTHKKYQEKF